MLKIIALVLALSVAAVLVYAATRPDRFTLQRSATIAAPPDKLFAQIDDLKAFNAWNPFARQDPKARIDYEGAPSGLGAAYRWQGGSSGAGRIEIIESAPPSKVVMRLDFEAPMKTTNRADFTIVPQGASTQVIWTMSGPMTYLSKLITIFVSMDRMVGDQFEAGLASLKPLAEAR